MHNDTEPDAQDLEDARGRLDGRGLLQESDYDRPEAPALPRWDSRRGTETAVGPWRRVGDFYEAAGPLAAGPTRYRVLERVEPRHEWRPRYVPPATYPSAAELSAGDWVEWDDEIRLGPHWYEFPGDTIERFSPEIDYDELTLHARQDETARRLRWRGLPDDRPEPDVVMWDDLPPEERLRLRMLEYECPWLEYEVTVPDLPRAGDFTAAQRELEALISEHPDGENHGRYRGTVAGGEGGERPIELGPDAPQRRDFLATGWSIEYVVTGGPAGRRPVDVTDDILEAFLRHEVVGAVDLVRKLTEPGGRRSPAMQRERLALARRVAAVLHDGAGSRDGERVVKALSEIYGRSRSTFYALAKLGGWRKGGLTFTPTVTPNGERTT